MYGQKPPTESSHELEQTLGVLKANLAYLKQTRDRLEVELKQTKASIDQLQGVWRNDGDIKRAEEMLAWRKRIEEDESKPAIVWKTKSPWSGWYDNNEKWVLVKKTAKRIYIRKAGDTQEKFYNLDGTNSSKYDGVIDVEASGIV